MKTNFVKKISLVSILLLSIVLVSVFCLNSLTPVVFAEANEVIIKTYDETQFDTRVASPIENCDAIIMSKDNLLSVTNNELNKFIISGGIVIVDEYVDGQTLNSKLNNNVIACDESNDEYFGFSLYFNEEQIVADHIFIVKVDDGRSAEKFNPQKKAADLALDIVKNIKSKRVSISERNERTNFVYGAASFYFSKSDGTRTGSLSITSYVYEVAKALDSSGITRGVYDVRTKYIIDAESNFYIKDYDVVLGSSQNVIDSSFLQSEVQTTVSLGGSLGFSGKVIEGSLDAGVSYTYSGTSQKITNDLPMGNTKYWQVDDLKKNYGASFALEPCIRIVNTNDNDQNHIFARIDDFLIKEKSGWINPSYKLDQSARMNLNLQWNKDGHASYYVSKV